MHEVVAQPHVQLAIYEDEIHIILDADFHVQILLREANKPNQAIVLAIHVYILPLCSIAKTLTARKKNCYACIFFQICCRILGRIFAPLCYTKSIYGLHEGKKRIYQA